MEIAATLFFIFAALYCIVGIVKKIQSYRLDKELLEDMREGDEEKG